MANISASKSKIIYSNASSEIGYILTAFFEQKEISTTTNKSTIEISGSFAGDGIYWTTSHKSTIDLYWYDDNENVNGTLVSSLEFAGLASYFDVKSLSGSIEVTHKEDGTLNGYAKLVYTKGKTTSSYAPASNNIATDETTLTKINRKANILSVTEFTDEGSPTIAFDNPANFNLKAKLRFLETIAEDTAEPFEIFAEPTTSPYTFSIDDTTRQSIWSVTNQKKEYIVEVVLETYDENDNLIGSSSVPTKMTYVNAEPTFISTVTETIQKAIDLLGSSSETLIQNFSNVLLEATPTTKKNATVKTVQFLHNNILVTADSSPYQYNFDVKNSVFKITLTDSRGYVVEKEIVKNIIEYFPIEIQTFSFKREEPTSSNLILNAQIKYKQTAFGETVNSPTIQWGVGSIETLNTVSSDSYSIDTVNNEITINDLILSNVLEYTKEKRLYIYVSDVLTDDVDNEVVSRGIPTCDMGEHDFQVNGQLFIADTNRENKIDVKEEINEIIKKNGDIQLAIENTKNKIDEVNNEITNINQTLDNLKTHHKINNNELLFDDSIKIIPTLLKGSHYQNYGGCYYYKVGTRVFVHIGINGLTANTLSIIFTLPVGYRPNNIIAKTGIAGTLDTDSRGQVSSDGQVLIRSENTYALVDIEFEAIQ